MSLHKTLKVKIDHLLSDSDKRKLWSLSFDQTIIYNKALEYTKENSFDFKQLHLAGKNIRNELELTSNSKLSQNTVIRLINNWKGFLALRKTDETARAPKRYASTWKFQPLMFDWNSGCGGFKLNENGFLILSPKFNIKLPKYAHRVLNDVDYSVATATISQNQKNEFYISFCINSPIEAKLNSDNWLSIDPGLTHTISLVTSDGQAIKFRNKQFKGLEKKISALQSKLDKKKKYSKRYNKLRITFRKKKQKLSNKNRNYQHKLTAEVISFCHENDIGTIFYGDIKTKSLTKSKMANKGMNKSTQNRGTLGRTKEFLWYKAGFNGITFNLVNEAYTSKTNCLTDEIFPKMDLSTRSVELIPGLIIDRDINGAINIARKFQGTWSPHLNWLRNLVCSERHVAS